MADPRVQLLEKLRAWMVQRGFQALVITGSDPHESEYLADRWQVRRFVTGFTGSAGMVVITLDQAGLWTDSRYWLQGEAELAGSGYALFKDGIDPGVGPWLAANLGPCSKVGFEARTCSLARLRRWQGETAGAKLGWEDAADLWTEFWPQRPELPSQPVWDYQAVVLEGGEPLGLVPRTEKINQLRQAARARGADSLLLTALDEVAWTLNLRGSDVAFNPVFHGWLHIGSHRSCLFVAPGVLEQGLVQRLDDQGIDVADYDDLTEGWLSNQGKGPLAVAPENLNTGLWTALANLTNQGKTQVIETVPSLCASAKTVKTDRELALVRRAMEHDGTALVRFLAWFDREKDSPTQPELWTEPGLSAQLEAFRRQVPSYRGPSFSPIAGFRDHGAIVHYSAQGPGAPVSGPGLLLLDTGAQYLEGTTDITRTLAVGPVGPQEIEDYTLVLRAHIRAALARFPRGTRGYSIDAQARAVLWNRDLSYGHGTGHGVGHFLCVHEGPVRLNTEPLPYALEIGMILSNEPGLYRPGLWGIRLENLQAVRLETTNDFGTFLGWETLTLCPFARELIDPVQLNQEERAWLDSYHAFVWDRLQQKLEGPDRKWLKDRCAPLES